MSIARSIVGRVDELRLRQARADAHRARLAFLRADWRGSDLRTPSRRVVLATARLEQLQSSVQRQRRSH